MKNLRLDTRDDGVVRLTLDRPEARNALTPDMVAGVPEVLRSLEALPPAECRALVLGGAGPVFCAGADLNAMRESGQADEAANREDARRFAILFRSVARFPAPVIAVVRGAALGGGLGLAVAADHVVASPDARFGTPEAHLGLVPAVISPYVVRRLGPGRAAPFLLGGEVVRGDAAIRAGLAHECADDPEEAAEAVVRRYLESAPLAARRTKALLLREAPLPPGDVEELTIRTIAAARASAEGQAGTAAFFERKPPPWSPRSR